MKIKTSELIGAQLDWAVAKATDTPINILSADNPDEKWQTQCAIYPHGPFWPSQDWSQGGPLIERFKIDIEYHGESEWCGFNDEPGRIKRWIGSTPLIAAMRTIVYMRLGDEVDVPEGLA